MISGLQHFRFCRRQWALIHIEQQWAENLRTVEGELMHERAHDESLRESRGDTIITRSLRVYSLTLGLSGQCDVVEFKRSAQGVPLHGHDGLWLPYPVEYKRGKPKDDGCDELQLCAQAMCLEEMLCCRIDNGFIYHDALRRRESVAFSDELRNRVRDVVAEMHRLFEHAHTPKVRKRPGCGSCSLREICLPELGRSLPVHTYISRALGEKQEDGI